VRVHVRGTTYESRVVDLRGRPVDGRALAAAVRGERCVPAVDAPAATLVYGYCGYVGPEMGVRTRTALAAAARTRGVETPHDDAIADLRERVAAIDAVEPSLPPARKSVADEDIAALRESVAATRGRLWARERLDGDTAEVESDLRETAQTLATRETERTAAAESRQQRREAARAYRDRLERRRRLTDRLANRRRDAREALVDAVSDRYASALDDVPGTTTDNSAGPTPDDPFDAEPVPAALAVLRVARTDAPVVLETNRLGTPTSAAAWLDAPVIRC